MQETVALIDPDQAVLGSSVLHYAFFPISQLFQASPRGPADLPDRTKQEAFGCLALLIEQWWSQWADVAEQTTASGQSQTIEEKVQLWRQLLILASITLTDAPAKTGAATTSAASKNSIETSLAIVKLLHALLVPRRRTPRSTKASTPSADWEWDGESPLPSLDEADEDMPQGAQASICYPSQQHLRLIDAPSFKSPLLHALTACLDLAVDSANNPSTVELRCTAITVVHVIGVHWLPGSKALSGATMVPIMPGVVSKVARLLTSTPEASSAKRASPKLVAGELVARAIGLLKSVVVPVLSDAHTLKLRGGLQEGTSTSRSLEEVVEATRRTGDDTVSQAGDQASQAVGSSSDQTSPTVNPLVTTMQNFRRALLPLQGRPTSKAALSSKEPIFSETDDSIVAHPHPLAQQSLVLLAVSLLEECGAAIKWYEELDPTGSQDDDGPRLSNLLLNWLLDLAADSQASRKTMNASRESLSQLLEGNKAAQLYSSRLAEEAVACMEGLPRLINGQRAARASILAERVTTILSVATSASAMHQLSVYLNSQSAIERWGNKLLSCLEIEASSPLLGEDHQGQVRTDLPIPPLRNLDKQQSLTVSSMLKAIGSLAGRLLWEAAQAEAASVATKGKSRDVNSPGSLLTYFFDRSRQLRRFAEAQGVISEASCQALTGSTAALFIARQLVCGIVEVLQDSRISLEPGKLGRRLRKRARQLADEVIKEVIDCWQAEYQALTEAYDEPATAAEDEAKQQAQQQHLLRADDTVNGEMSDRVQGLSVTAHQGNDQQSRPERFGPALNLAFVSAATVSSPSGVASGSSSSIQSRRALAQSQLLCQRSLQAELLGPASLLLGPGYQPHLLTTLYPLVSALTQASPVVAQAASRSLETISYASGYADLLSCVRENLDYILGEASWRLVAGLGRELEATTSRRRQAQQQQLTNGETTSDGSLEVYQASSALTPLLSARTPPIVLTEVMRLLGPSSLHLIEDSIDEVLDALDRFHGYEDVCDAMLGVLDRLLEVMKQETTASSVRVGELLDLPHKARHARPGSNRDLDDLMRWLDERQTGLHLRPPSDLPSAFDAVESGPKSLPADDPSPHAPATAASRSQELLVSILKKAMPFLSHSSPVIRARVLRLLGAGTQLLAPNGESVKDGESKSKWTRREDDLLPLVNSAWPLILARLGWTSNRPLPTSYSKHRRVHRDDLSAEADFRVHLEAVKLLETFARHIPDFMAKRMTEEAWPRVKMLLELEETESQEMRSLKPREGPTTRYLKDGPSETRIAAIGDSQSSVSLSRASKTQEGQRFRPMDPSSPFYQLLMATLSMLRPLLLHQGPLIPDIILWDMLTFGPLLAALDARQPQRSGSSVDPSTLRQKAVDLWRATDGCDSKGTAWTVLQLLGEVDSQTHGHQIQWNFLSKEQGFSLNVALSAAQVFVQ